MIKSTILAAMAVAGIGSAAQAATGYCDRSDYYDPPIMGTKVKYTFDLFFKEAETDDGSSITSYGPYTKETGIPMRASITYLPADYCADITLTSLGKKWNIADQSWGGGFFATGTSPMGESFVLSFLNRGEENLLTLTAKNLPNVGWVDLAVENIQIAPVPLPASSALLPLGFGALAMMRKRRKKVS
ncbi:VPLPA-CTERM sorting domain-containing protein [Paracoccus hibiscisoli]|uniref:VPLPA-CTERM sorting domain-containing protein n=1 Tax=Paracoccus hibiscisoli TaxID=2023261 RepID=A0A4U0QWH4_9RHOB|nr:VPLPA-CTERM sorting domain-containing protein [Paracoccus hibiscisoli]TJZ86170.1 VPLPA-CTERM sorting domain-containing protein [Paracoccus hibiscisoli]